MNIFFFTQYILMFDCLEIYRSAMVVKSARAFGQIVISSPHECQDAVFIHFSGQWF